METLTYASMTELQAGMAGIRQSPRDQGILKMIVCRPAEDERQVVTEAQLTLQDGLAGDNWKFRGSRHRPDRSANPDAQITVMNARLIGLVARSEDRWPLAGDQLYIDLDLSAGNLPPGTRLAVGTAVIEVSALPHTGCKKFAARFGVEAMKFVNSPEGKQLRLRGINARVIQPGVVRLGDNVRKI